MKPKYILILFLSPLFWWTIIFNFSRLTSELSKAPQYISHQKSSVFSPDNLKKVDDLRWYDQTKRQNFYSKVFFNKATVLIGQFFEGFANFGPRTFFFSGDSFGGSPKSVEPIPIILLPLSFLGLLRLVKTKKRIILIYPLFGLIPFLTGQPTLFYIFPVGLFYIYCAITEISFWKNRPANTFLIFFCLYSIFLFFRSLL